MPPETTQGINGIPVDLVQKITILNNEMQSVRSGSLTGVVRGIIVMWSGKIANIPTGWHLCDGDEDTPDLRDKFILGVSAEEEPGGTGGAHSRTLLTANLPAHTHGSVGNHVHTFYTGDSSDNDSYNAGPSNGPNQYSHNVSGAGGHTHSSVGSGTAFDNRPAYYKLAYIMKI